MIEEFVDFLKLTSEKGSPENRPQISALLKERTALSLGGPETRPQVVVLPFSSIGSAPSLAKRITANPDDILPLELATQGLLETIFEYYSSEIPSDERTLWKHEVSVSIDRAISIWGFGGVLSDEGGLFSYRSETIAGFGFEDTFFVQVGGVKRALARTRYTQNPAPQLNEFEAVNAQARPLLESVLTYAQATQRYRPRQTFLLYVHFNEPLTSFPMPFLEGVARRVLDFGRLESRIHAEVLVFTSAIDASSLPFSLKPLHRVFLQRRSAEEYFFVGGDRLSFEHDFMRSDCFKSWRDNFSPVRSSIEYLEATLEEEAPISVALMSGLWMGDYRTSREIRQEEIYTLRD
jgi:hypothetical protein